LRRDGAEHQTGAGDGGTLLSSCKVKWQAYRLSSQVRILMPVTTYG
jgi:hypothetical protein